MFEHIGRKVKIFAKTLFWVEAIASGILGLIVAIKAESALLFPLIALSGALAAYLSVIVLYVIAQLVDNSDVLVETSRKQLEALNALQTLLQSAVSAALAQTQAMPVPTDKSEAESVPAAESEADTFSDTEAAQNTEPTPQAEPEKAPEEAPEEISEEGPGEAPEEVSGKISEEEPDEAPEEASEAEPANAQHTAPEPEIQEHTEPQTQEQSVLVEPEHPAQAQCEAPVEPLPEKTCKVCGFGLTDDVYCPNCGSKISKQEQPSEEEQPVEPSGVCPGCGYENAFGKFCPRCGLRLSGAERKGERRGDIG